MKNKFKEMGKVLSQECIAKDIYSMWIQTDEVAGYAKAGQFISVYTNDNGKLLPRPISICEIDKNNKSLRIVYRVTGAGTGTEQFSKLGKGDAISILGPLGNGFTLSNKKAILIGGGIGVPPMLEVAKQLDCEKIMVMGYRDEVFLKEDLKQQGSLYIATEDGSSGTRGNVLDAIKENDIAADVIYACGPTPMLRAIKEYAIEQKIECFVSMEEKMACGIGACLACVCKTKDKDVHSNVNNTRICKDGPVFLATEVEL